MIRLESISKSFGRQEVLKDISFEVTKGEKLCVIGKSGSGKSVLMKCITGLLQPDAGRIYVENDEVTSLSEKEMGRVLARFGVVFQGAALFDSLSVLENVGLKLFEDRVLPPAQIRERVVESLEEVGLSADILGKCPAALSGGMKKRVGIARAVIQKPEYLFYDEPTTGLDPVTSDTIDDLIERLAREKDRTSIIITHDMATVRKIATRVALIHQHHLHFFGSSDELMGSEDPVIREFLFRSRQFGGI